jgi:hypothetical protein
MNFLKNQSDNLDQLFLNEIKACFQKIQANPERYQIIEQNIHKLVVTRFPFNIIYEIYPEEIVIIAFAHQKRKPDYWKERL